ncbi:MAG: undecaprenyldiphospho-muramoylpentapeptide beta-N-acetylglucosaminyltransferase [Candidatus Merdivicinus sp.]|jgi:UDP-N-acetylglucosamine--N-acetylmuramyl-(pentapeptide) pyrophosphoryl-undecaprenol N-acetylglucosamine transferase
MKFILVGGGTGGHINPAIAIANELKAKLPDAEFLFIANPDGMENTLVPKAGYPVAHIRVTGFARGFSMHDLVHNVKTVSYLASADFKARKILRDFHPDAVIGTGGYLGGPIVMEAQKMKIPTFIHEQNAFPGVTNKLLAKKADIVFLAFEEAKSRMPEGIRCETVGNPIRQSFLSMTKAEARRKLGLDDAFTIFSVGGSLGANKINEIAADLMAWHSREGKINHIHGYGKHGRENFPKMLAERGVDLSKCPRIDAREYIDNMDLCMTAADLIISRAGAITISELEVVGRASILVPYPYAAENHQYHNAKVLENHGAAILVEEKDYQKEDLLEKVKALAADPAKTDEFGRNAASLAVYDTADRICQCILAYLDKKRNGRV